MYFMFTAKLQHLQARVLVYPPFALPLCVSTQGRLLKGCRLLQALLVYGIKLVPITRNLVDFIWTDRPHPQPKPLMVHKFVYTGTKHY